jgi:hypothetical protein
MHAGSAPSTGGAGPAIGAAKTVFTDASPDTFTDAALDLPTGRLIVGDPAALFGDARPLDLDLPPGRHPVRAWAGGFELLLATAEPADWQTAVPGFGTPSGHVCLLDEAALSRFTDLGDEPVDEYELLAERMAGQPDEPVEFRGLLVLPAGEALRTVRVGRDERGRPVRLAADFQSPPTAA